jgi:hypothetical protein
MANAIRHCLILGHDFYTLAESFMILAPVISTHGRIGEALPPSAVGRRDLNDEADFHRLAAELRDLGLAFVHHGGFPRAAEACFSVACALIEQTSGDVELHRSLIAQLEHTGHF